MLAPQPDDQMVNITKLIPEALVHAHHLQPMLTDLKEEVLYDYEFSLRKAISKNQIISNIINSFLSVVSTMLSSTVYAVLRACTYRYYLHHVNSNMTANNFS